MVLGSKSNPVQLMVVNVAEVMNIEKSVLLLKLSEKVEFSQSIAPACLWQDKTSIPFDGLKTFQLPKHNTTDLNLVRLRPYQNSVCRSFVTEASNDSNGISEKLSCAKADEGLNLCGLEDGITVQAIRNETNVVVPYLVGIRNFVANCKEEPILFFNRIADIIETIIRSL